MRIFFFSSRRRHTRYWRDWSSDVCSSDLRLGRGVHPLTNRTAATLGGVARAVGGELTGGDTDARVADVTHDSRQAREGWLFVAIRGEKTDGNRFAPDVMKQGAAGVISDIERPDDFAGAWIREIGRAS